MTAGEGIEGTRRRVQLAELESVVPGPLSVSPSGDQQTTDDGTRTTDRVIDVYGRYRLLTFDRDPLTRGPTVEVAHEALLRKWGRLRGWLEASREELGVQRRLAAEAQEWANAGQDASFLATGARLAQFEALAEGGDLALTADELAYIAASVLERDRQQRREQERQQHDLAQAHVLAEEQRRRAETEQRRADEQSQAAARLRRRALYLASALIVALVAAVAAGFFANSSATLATQNANVASTAQAEAQLRAAQQGLAQANFTRAEAERLAAEANTLLKSNGNSELIALLSLR